MNQLIRIICSRGPEPGDVICTKESPVSLSSRAGLSNMPCELPKTAASKIGLRPLLALAVC
jgi:hypothetical protein